MLKAKYEKQFKKDFKLIQRRGVCGVGSLDL